MSFRHYITALVAMLVITVSARAQGPYPAVAAYIGSGSPLIWTAWNSAAIFGALPYTPPNAVALYCQATSGGPWTPCVPGLGITSPINLFAGSTINGTAICLVNGTNCPASSSIPNAALTMTAATSDTATVTGATAGMHCTFSAADPISAAQITTLYISAVGTGTVTITHTAGASGGTVNILCP